MTLWKVENTDFLAKEGRAFTHPVTNIKYPSNWCEKLSAEQKIELKLIQIIEDTKQTPWDFTPLEDQPMFEEDGITPSIDNESGEQALQKGLKSLEIEKAYQTSKSLLEKTDYAYIQERDNGDEVKVEVKAFRKAVRETLVNINALVSACTSKAELKALIDNTDDAPSPLSVWPNPKRMTDYVAAFVPDQVPMLDAIPVLMEEGNINGTYYDQMMAFLSSLDNPLATLKFQRADNFKRSDPLVIAGLAQLGIGAVEEKRLMRKMVGIVDESTDNPA